MILSTKPATDLKNNSAVLQFSEKAPVCGYTMHWQDENNLIAQCQSSKAPRLDSKSSKN